MINSQKVQTIDYFDEIIQSIIFTKQWQHSLWQIHHAETMYKTYNQHDLLVNWAPESTMYINAKGGTALIAKLPISK